MRILFASLMAVTAVAFAAPSFAQEATPPSTLTPPPAKAAKPRAGTAAYCNTLKTDSAKSSCLKRVQTASAKSHKTTPKKPVTKPDTSAQLSAPAAAPATAAPVSQGAVAVPPLPQKTI